MNRRKTRLLPLLLLLVAAGLAGLVLWFGLKPGAPVPNNEPEIAESPPPAPVERTPAPVFDLSGRIVDRASGYGIRHTTVQLACDAEPDTVQTDITDRDGDFAFRTVPNGACDLSVASDDFVAAGPDPVGRATVNKAPSSPLDGVQLYLHAVATVRGRVLADGKPAANVSVSALYLEAPGHPRPFSVSSDIRTASDGSFSLTHLGPGKLRVLAESDSHGLAEGNTLSLHAGETLKGILIELVDAGTVEGRVVGPGSVPIPDAGIRLSREDGLKAQVTESDADGRFRLANVRSGQVSLLAVAHGYRGRAFENLEVSADEVTELTIQMERRPGFGGLVLKPDGSPAVGAAVYVATDAPALDPAELRPTGHSDSKGRFWIDRVPAQPAVAWARHMAYATSARVAVGGSETDLVLELRQGGVLVGEVTDSNGLPIAAYSVRAQPRGGRASVRSPDGRFRTPSVEPGRYSLVVTVPGRPEVTTGRFLVKEGGETDVGRIVVGLGGTLLGRAVDQQTGAPLPGTFVRAEGGRGATAGPDGRFRLSGLASRNTSLWLNRPGYIARVISGLVPPDGSQLDLGDLTLAPKKPGQGPRMQYSGVGIQIRFGADRLTVTRVFDGGPASIAGLEPNTAILSINGRPVSELTSRQAVELLRGEAGSEVQVEIIRPGGAFAEALTLERGEVEAGH